MILSGLFPFIHSALLLTLSFFVLFAVAKIDSNSLKIFGRIIASLLCILAIVLLIVFSYFSIIGVFPENSRIISGKYHYMLR